MIRAVLKFTFALLGLMIAGCYFSERSVPLEPSRIKSVQVDQPLACRDWLAAAHGQLESLLPPAPARCLLTEDCVVAQKPASIVEHFGQRYRFDRLETMWINWLGLSYSAQAVGQASEYVRAEPWEGFADVWVPIDSQLSLAGRMGLARNAAGQPIEADCIIILPGLRGSNNILRLRDLAIGLRQMGLHVLTLEIRGQAQTELAYPQVPYTWGVAETRDLLIVSQWLMGKPFVRRTGLIGYSWGANHVLLAAWMASWDQSPPPLPLRLEPMLLPRPQGGHFEAGVLAFSPVVRFDVIADKLEQPRSYMLNPVLAGIQATIRRYMEVKNHPDPSGSAWELIRLTGLEYPAVREDFTDLLAITPTKLQQLRVPTLLVHGANDPLVSAQDVVDVIAQIDNPNIAAIILPSGGHIGFGPWAGNWYYSLITNFFLRGPKAM